MTYLKRTDGKVLMGSRAYLSGPIENCESETNWRIEPKKILSEEFQVDVFDPFDDPKQQWVPVLEQAKVDKDYDKIAEIAKAFVRKDLCMVDRSDYIIARLPYKVATTGTHHEIIVSNDAKKPTLLVCPEGKEHVPAWYYGFIPHRFMFSSFGELYEYLREVDDGKHRDEDRWAFVYGLV
tara:strand:- start:6634 stop:7173 length:540 start_codon:yes stop_codon:yes gene_type:complete